MASVREGLDEAGEFGQGLLEMPACFFDITHGAFAAARIGCVDAQHFAAQAREASFDFTSAQICLVLGRHEQPAGGSELTKRGRGTKPPDLYIILPAAQFLPENPAMEGGSP